MAMFTYLAIALVVPGLAPLVWVLAPFALGGWITGVLLVVFAFLLRSAAAKAVLKEEVPHE